MNVEIKLAPEAEPKLLGDLLERVLDDEATMRHGPIDERGLFTGNGDVHSTYRRYLNGWDKTGLIAPEYCVGDRGSVLELRKIITEHYRWRRKVGQTSSYNLSFTYNKDMEGRTQGTLFREDLDPAQPIDPTSRVARLLQADLDSQSE